MPPTNEKPVMVSKSDLEDLLRKAVNQAPTGSRVLSISEIEEVASKGVLKAFTTLGIDVEHPLQMQADFHFIRKFRKSWNSTISGARGTAVGILVTGILGALYIGLRAIFLKGQ